MKHKVKILPSIVTAIVVMLCMACNDENIDQTPAGQLTVLKSDLDFTCKADTHDIEVSTLSPLTAVVNKTWCQATVEGNLVHVAVERNTQLEARNAIITLKTPTDSLQMSVTQSGAVWMVRGASSYSASDEDTTIVIPATLDFEYTVTKPDWMDGEEVEDGYQLHLHTNDTGGAREGNVTFKSSQGSKVIKFRQFGKRSVGGQYDITYSYIEKDDDGKETTKTTKQRIEIEADNAKTYLYLKGLNPTYPVPVLMGSDGTLHIANGHQLDGVKEGYVFIVLHQEGPYQNFIFAGDCDYEAPLKLTNTKGILLPSFTFAKKVVSFIDPTGSEATATADGFSLKTATMPDIRFTQAGTDLGTYINVKLTKVIE